MASPPDPMVKTYGMPTPQVSKKVLTVAGIVCTVYGLEELPSRASEVSCLYALHARGVTMDSMGHVASAAIADWNQRLREKQVAVSQQNKGLIAVCIDQRNHGSREVDSLRNEAWRAGNPSHAQDMWTIFNGTCRDVSNLIDVLHCYIFPKGERRITNNLVIGVSLGAHATWNLLLHEPRITTGVVIVGCSDYINLMSDRARLSKLESWKSSDPPGSKFLGSESFPQPLIELLKHWDPAAFFFGQMKDNPAPGIVRNGNPVRDPTENEKRNLRSSMQRSLGGKRILNLAGGADKLVPYHRGENFLTWFKKAIRPGGWFADGNVSLEDVIYEGVGHEVTPPMVNHAVKFLGETLASGEGRAADQKPASRL